MRFDKRLWMARWAGDEETVRSLAEALGAEAEQANDVVLQENLFEAQLTAAASQALEEGGISDAIETFEQQSRMRLQPAAGKPKHHEFLLAVSGRIERRLKDLQRQLAFKERRQGEKTQIFVESRRELQQRDYFRSGRFYRVGHHPHGVELRSYIRTRQWVHPDRVAASLRKGGFEDITIGQRAVLVRADGEQLLVHGDSRVHCIFRTRQRDRGVQLIKSLSGAIDELWGEE